MCPYYWMHYERTEPKAVKDGLKAKSQRGSIGETWWSKRWVAVLESFDLGSRLSRGKSYARKGQVIGIDVKEGSVKARVQGTFSQPYKVTIELEPFTNEEWGRVLKVMAEKAAFSAHLLSGQMPKNIEEAFSGCGLSLFPGDGSDLETNCTCPDWSNPCKHIAAVYYLLAEEFDRDPFLIFKLRGKGKDELMEELRALRCQGAMQEEIQKSGSMPGCLPGVSAASIADSVKPLEECLDSYWQMGKDASEMQIKPRPPEVENAILKRLGSSPFIIGKSNLTDLLREAYSLAGRRAVEREGLLDEDSSDRQA